MNTRTFGSMARPLCSLHSRWVPSLLVLVLVALPVALSFATPSQAVNAASSGSGVTTRANGTLLVDGRPFYPLGVYTDCCSGYDRQVQALRAAAAAGFNVVHAAYAGDFMAYMDLAQSLGVKIIVEDIATNPPGTVALYVNRLKDHPALLGYNIRDDGNAAQVAETQRRYDLIRSLDPYHLTYMATDEVYAHGSANLPYVDMAYDESYMYEGNPLWIGAAGTATLCKKADALGGKTCGGIPETHARFTANQIRFGFWSSIVGGAHGLIAYVFDNDWDTSGAASWTETKALMPEVGSLAPALLDGTFARIQEDNNGIYASSWRYQGSIYVVVVNVGGGTKSASVPLPAGTLGPAHALFPRYDATLSLNGGKLTGSMPTQSSQVYRFDAA